MCGQNGGSELEHGRLGVHRKEIKAGSQSEFYKRPTVTREGMAGCVLLFHLPMGQVLSRVPSPQADLIKDTGNETQRIVVPLSDDDDDDTGCLFPGKFLFSM